MGTRADFYLGTGKTAEWLGSIAYDGTEVPDAIIDATNDTDYRGAVAEFIAGRDDGTRPEHGWPWPWNDSGTTDVSYWFHGGKCEQSFWGRKADDEDGPKREMPDMSDRKNVTLGARSGLLILRTHTEQ